MRRIQDSKGEGNLGCIFWLLVLGIAGLIAWNMVPVKIKSAELYDYMVDQAGYATNFNSTEAIIARILTKARELDIPLEKDALKVERVGDHIRMRATYTVPVEFPGYTYYWDFDHEVDRPLYIF